MTIPMIPLLLQPMIKAYQIEESYFLPDGILCQTIWESGERGARNLVEIVGASMYVGEIW